MALRLLVDRREAVVLDFDGRDPEQDLRNEMSAVSYDGRYLWTGSDEGRGAEWFQRRGRDFRLKRRVKLGKLFRKMPKKGEADLEGLDARYGRLWLTGSHCRVRPKGKRGPKEERCRAEPSRELLGTVRLDRKGLPKRKSAEALPFKGKRSLRGALKRDPHLAPFLKLPSKENGLDVEGLVTTRKHVFLGLRGPVIASQAVVLEVPQKSLFRDPNRGMKKHFLDLGGLGIRDLARYGKDILILAGPITATGGPFRLFRWRRRRVRKDRLKLLHEWKLKQENPEGICYLERKGRPGLLVLYDNPKERVRKSTYAADWFPLAT